MLNEKQLSNRFHRSPFMRARYNISDPTLHRYVQSGKVPKPRYINNQRVWDDGDVEEADRNLITDAPTDKLVKTLASARGV